MARKTATSTNTTLSAKGAPPLADIKETKLASLKPEAVILKGNGPNMIVTAFFEGSDAVLKDLEVQLKEAINRQHRRFMNYIQPDSPLLGGLKPSEVPRRLKVIQKKLLAAQEVFRFLKGSGPPESVLRDENLLSRKPPIIEAASPEMAEYFRQIGVQWLLLARTDPEVAFHLLRASTFMFLQHLEATLEVLKRPPHRPPRTDLPCFVDELGNNLATGHGLRADFILQKGVLQSLLRGVSVGGDALA